jgi:hypothetical protein
MMNRVRRVLSGHPKRDASLQSKDSVQKEKEDEQAIKGDVEDGGKNYKTMSWWHCGLIMLAETVSLGVMSLPWAISKIGLVP